ncbi:MAG: hypothetical protein QOE35_1312 [Actinomycetota bacterium]|jgi:hypothetical protein
MSDPIETYLDQLVLELRGRAPDVRRVLAEVGDHLTDVAAELEAAGATTDQARADAVTRMGSPRDVARGFAAVPNMAVVRQLVVTLAFLAGIGLVAVGASGALAAGMGSAFGKDFVAGDPNGVTYTKARCDYFLEYYPAEGTCAKAAVAHHYDEVVMYRAGAGVLGLLALGAAWLMRRRWKGDDLLLPDGFAPIIAVTLFGAAGAWLLLDSFGLAVVGGETNGVGQWLSGGVVAAAMAAVYLRPLARSLLVRSARG